nr:CpaF family protein [Rhodoferax sp.]
VQIARLTDGRRRVVSLQEIVGVEGDIISMQEIFAFTQTGVKPDGEVLGYFSATGVWPQFMVRLKAYDNAVPEDTFNPNKTYE